MTPRLAWSFVALLYISAALVVVADHFATFFLSPLTPWLLMLAVVLVITGLAERAGRVLLSLARRFAGSLFLE